MKEHQMLNCQLANIQASTKRIRVNGKECGEGLYTLFPLSASLNLPPLLSLLL